MTSIERSEVAPSARNGDGPMSKSFLRAFFQKSACLLNSSSSGLRP